MVLFRSVLQRRTLRFFLSAMDFWIPFLEKVAVPLIKAVLFVGLVGFLFWGSLEFVRWVLSAGSAL